MLRKKMKKIICLVSATLFVASSVLAGPLVGVKLGVGDLEATKNTIVNVPVALNENQESSSIDHAYGAIFVETPVKDGPVSVGFELVPLTGTISISGKNHTDASVELSMLKTIYALVSKDVANGGSVYGKLGYAHADIDNAKQSNGTTTINSFDSSLEGPMVGVGFQAPETSNGLVFRAEATMTMFDDVSVKTTGTNEVQETKTASDIDLTTFTVSIAKQF
jgi:hypothetical protein